MGTLRIDVLGRFRISAAKGFAAVSVSSRGREILAALLLAEPSLSREMVAARLWPESDDQQARTNLRRELHHLRRALPSGAQLLTSADDGLLQLSSPSVMSDVYDFRAALATAASAKDEHQRAPRKIAALSAAVAAYSGDLLLDTFAEWLIPERERLREQATGALRELALLLEQAGETAAAIGPARRLVEFEPYDEVATRALMRLQAASGERAAAIHSFHRCASALHRELSAKPEPATQELYRDLLAGTVSFASAGSAPATPLRGTTSQEAPFEGRLTALAALNLALPSSEARAALVLGVAGIGKSRLAEEAARSFESRGAVVAHARAYAAEGGLAYAPVVEWLRSPGMRAALDGLDATLRRDLAPLLTELRAAHTDDAHYGELGGGGPVERQLRMFEAIAAVLVSSGRPVVLVLDDLQWCDAATLTVMHFLGRYPGGAPLLMILTARPGELEDNPEALDLLRRWREGGELTEMELQPLTREETAHLAVHLAPDSAEAMSEAEQQHLFELSEGNPLFIIEAVRLGPGVPVTGGPVEAASISSLVNRSPSVRAVLQGRLSQLGAPALALARCAAVIGRSFDYEVLLPASGLSEAELVWALDELWRRRIVRDTGERAYDFSHDALREAAAATLSAAHARLLHRNVAQTLEAVYGATLDRVSAAVANHYEQAGLYQRAIDAYDRAARASSAVYAHGEAVDLLERAFSLLARAPEGRERDQRELELLLRVAPLLRATSGYTSPRLAAAMERAITLALRLNDSAGRFHALWHLWTVRFVAGALLEALDIARELHSLTLDLPGLRGESHHAVGGTLTNMGAFSEGLEQLEAARVAFQGNPYRPRGALFGADLATFTHAWEAHALWLTGFEERALGATAAAVATAEEIGHRYSQALAHSYAAVLHYMRHDRSACAVSAAAALAVCDRYGFAYYRHWGALFAAWAGAERDAGASEAGMKAALASLEAEGARVRRPIYLAALAEVQILGGRPGAARATLQAAVKQADQSAEHLWDPELARLTALVATSPGAAMAAAQRAVASAQELGARPLLLRAAVTVGRLLCRSPELGTVRAARTLIEEALAAMPPGSATQERAEAHEVLSLLA